MLVLSVVVLVAGVPLLTVITWILMLMLSSAGPAAAAAMVVAAASGLALVAALLNLLRNAAWLEGTTLVVRGTFTTRRCDLATARQVILDSVTATTAVTIGTVTTVVPTGRRIPRLTAYQAGAGRPVRTLLSDRGGRRLLGPPQLAALAEAILAGGRADPRSLQTAATLRSWAGPWPGFGYG